MSRACTNLSYCLWWRITKIFIIMCGVGEPLRDYITTRLTFGVSALSFAANMAVIRNAIKLASRTFLLLVWSRSHSMWMIACQVLTQLLKQSNCKDSYKTCSFKGLLCTNVTQMMYLTSDTFPLSFRSHSLLIYHLISRGVPKPLN